MVWWFLAECKLSCLYFEEGIYWDLSSKVRVIIFTYIYFIYEKWISLLTSHENATSQYVSMIFGKIEYIQRWLLLLFHGYKSQHDIEVITKNL